MGAPPTHHYNQSTSVRVVCRCCLAEEEEMTNYLSLDAASSINLSFCNDDAAAGESSAATFLDCLNACARIGATLEDAELPLHICLDCCQALESCCEFIRCVQNADKILRRKRQLQPSSSKETESSTVSDIAEKSIDLKVPSPVIEVAADEQKLLPIGSLNIEGLIGNSQLENIKSDSNNCTQSQLTAATKLYHILYNTSAEDPGYQNIQNSIYETVEASNIYIGGEISSATNTNISPPNTKECESARVPRKQKNGNQDTHTLTPPAVEDNSKCTESSSNNQTILTKDFTIGAPCEHNWDSFAQISGDVKNPYTAKCATLVYEGRKYIVNAAIAAELKAFHDENQTKSNLCRFCIFMCDNQQEMDQHMASHLGPPCYSCPLCNFKCRFKYYLMKHLKGVHNASSDCLAETKLQVDLPDDMESASKFFCIVCQSFFSSFIALQQHHHIDEHPCFQCSDCAVQESHREQLMEHMAKEHKTFIDAHLIATYLPSAKKCSAPPENNETEKCLNRKFLSQFIKFHGKDQKGNMHLCQFCGRSFKRRFHLLKHVHYIHSKEKKKDNENCFKRRLNKFDRQRYTRHLLRSTQAEHQRKCDVCGRVFKTQAELSAHAQIHKSSQFQCLTCSTVFAFEFELKYHMRTHIDSNSSSPARSAYHVAEPSWSLNATLRSRLQKVNSQNKQSRMLSSTKRKSIQKRRLSLASVSTAKSSEEGSPNSPRNVNSDEDMPPALNNTTMSQGFQDDDSGNATTSINVADVLLPQYFQNTGSYRAETPTNDFVSQSSSSSLTDKHLNCDSSDQTYLNDFDLNFLDCSDDFLLQLF